MLDVTGSDGKNFLRIHDLLDWTTLSLSGNKTNKTVLVATVLHMINS